MTQIIIDSPLPKRAKERADNDPLYAHKTFRTDTDLARTLLEDYAKGSIISRQEVKWEDSELRNRVRNWVKDELERKKC